jgi:tripeptidyl-peptidase-1
LNGTGVYNRAGRGYPDVAAVGQNGVIVFQGGAYNDGAGTSMSAPIFAAILTRINEERLAMNLTVLGFVNPSLYENPSMFNDITIGDMSNGGECYGRGFKAVPGWDPVTGLGTPNYPAMLEYFLYG